MNNSLLVFTIGAMFFLVGCDQESAPTKSAPAEANVEVADTPELSDIDRSLAIAASNRDGEAMWEVFGKHALVDTAYWRTAQINGYGPIEKKLYWAARSGKISKEEVTNVIFSARVSLRACNEVKLAAACEIVGTAPQKEFKALAASLD